MLLVRLLAAAKGDGTLNLITADGKHRRIGSGSPNLTLRLHDHAVERDLLINPRLRFGEAYMNGRLVVERGDIPAGRCPRQRVVHVGRGVCLVQGCTHRRHQHIQSDAGARARV